MAAEHGRCRDGVSIVGRLSESGNIWPDGTDQAGGHFSAVEYCGRSYARIDEGVFEARFDCTGFPGGGGNAIGIGWPAEIYPRPGIGPVLEECVILGKQLYR